MSSILIVDDNLVNLKQIYAYLSQKHEVSLAKSGKLALQICEKEQPDLIILDVEMPEMDGFATIAHFKENPNLNHIPIIFMTGNNDAETEVKCLESGAVDFISKPVDSEILHYRIELHLQFSKYQSYLKYTIQELEDNIGISFAELLDLKDNYSANQVMRIISSTELLANKLLEEGAFKNELTVEYIETLKRAVPFHNIGKIGISDIIILKRGTLSEIEREEVRRHTTIGCRIIKKIYERTPSQRYLEMAMLIAEGHHERYDGTGYPNGLKGDDIPLCSRITALVNVYNSTVTTKVYRKALTHEEACKIIIDGRGTEFDPVIADVFLKNKNLFNNFKMDENLSMINRGWNLFHEANTGS